MKVWAVKVGRRWVGCHDVNLGRLTQAWFYARKTNAQEMADSWAAEGQPTEVVPFEATRID